MADFLERIAEQIPKTTAMPRIDTRSQTINFEPDGVLLQIPSMYSVEAEHFVQFMIFEHSKQKGIAARQTSQVLFSPRNNPA